MNATIFIGEVLFIGKGVFLTLSILIPSIIISTIGGIVISVMRYKFCYINKILSAVISVIRGTPIILQISFFYYVVLPSNCSIITCGIITLAINSSAYISEIFRSGINSIPIGQFEAAKVLHIPEFFMWKDIIVPQIIRNTLNSFINEVVTLLKETSIISIIGGADIMRKSQLIASEDFSFFIPYCIAGSYYYLLVLLIEYIGRIIEKRIAYDRN